jgi:hypothetical protein
MELSGTAADRGPLPHFPGHALTATAIVRRKAITNIAVATVSAVSEIAVRNRKIAMPRLAGRDSRARG